jgi:hypothetical protein
VRFGGQIRKQLFENILHRRSGNEFSNART